VAVFDGERVTGADSVLVQSGIITAVGRGLSAPAGVPPYDGQGGTVVPGLIDAHVHAVPHSLTTALRFGVTTVLDMFTHPWWLAAARRRRTSTARTNRADAWSAGILVTAPGGHGTQFPTRIPPFRTNTDADRFVADRLAEGSDYIKIVLEGGYPDMPWPTLNHAQVQALVAATHEHGARAVVHVSATADAVAAVAAGADVLMHAPFTSPFTDGQVETIRRHGVPVVATLSVISAMAGGHHATALRLDPRIRKFLTWPQIADLRRPFRGGRHPKLLDHALGNVRVLHRAGVSILAGTDAPNPGTTFGASMLTELELLAQAGLSPREVLTAATATPANVFALTDRGRIAAGLRADLLLIHGDPTADIQAMYDLAAIWKNGYSVNRRSWRPLMHARA
jgi:imidazolonepropionase-like amidohydrolase